jgi:prepilin-type N-terminal cleavage/methylation domain-containing protein
MNKQNKFGGFTLIEIAIVLVIIGLLTTGGGYLIAQQFQSSKRMQAKNELSTIHDSLLTYVKVNGYLPCPDKLTGNGAMDGVEDRKSNGSCSTREGQLPYQTLGVNDLDPWHNSYYYRVNARAEDINRVTDICQSASVFGAIKAGGVVRTKGANFAMCPETRQYYCRNCNDVCGVACDFNADPRPYTNRPPYFHTSTRPIGAEADGFKNLTITDWKAGNTLSELNVAVVVSFGSNGRLTWAGSNHCPTSLPSEEHENCDNDSDFIASDLSSFDDLIIGVTLNEVKRAAIEAGINKY